MARGWLMQQSGNQSENLQGLVNIRSSAGLAAAGKWHESSFSFCKSTSFAALLRSQEMAVTLPSAEGRSRKA